jgi:anion-transporting  ArsA/GET3 family ATPase
MEPVEFFKTSHVFIVAGKGGVGKTTVVAAMALMCSQNQIKTTVIELDDTKALPSYYGVNEPIGFEPTIVDNYLSLRLITPDEALIEYLETHSLRRISKRLISAGLVEIVSTAIPGIKDILLLGKIKQLERVLTNEVIIVDAPATGHAITFLTSPKGLLESARSGPVRDQAKDVLDLLTDPKRCQVILVTIAEETPINETIEAAYQLEDKVGIRLGPVVINALYPEIDKLENAILSIDRAKYPELFNAGLYYRERFLLQEKYLQKFINMLPLSYLRLPELFVSELSTTEIRILADEMAKELSSMQLNVLNQDIVITKKK